MSFWNKSVWWIAGFVALACLFALVQTAETGSGPVAVSSSSSSEPQYFTDQDDTHDGVSYGVTEDGHTTIYNRVPSDY